MTSLEDNSLVRQAFHQHDVVVADESIIPLQESTAGTDALGWILLHFADAGMATSCELILKYAIAVIQHLLEKAHKSEPNAFVEIYTREGKATLNIPTGEDVKVKVTIIKDMAEVLVTTGKKANADDTDLRFYSGPDNINRIYVSGTDPYTNPDTAKDFDIRTKSFGQERLVE